MSANEKRVVAEICKKYGNDRTRMMDIVAAVQDKLGCVSSTAMSLIAKEVSSHRVEVESVVSFYSFLSDQPQGTVTIRLCNDVIDYTHGVENVAIHGVENVAEALKDELGIDFGTVSSDGKFRLEWTPCIGMCDQAPAALVNNVVVTRLDCHKAREMVKQLKQTDDPQKLVKEFGDGNNGSSLVQSMVVNNIRERGEVIFSEMEPGAGIEKAINMSPAEVIREIKTARLRGRGGAGFPTGMKWEFTRSADGKEKVIICNADEGEPGTFKDRVLLTECADLLFEGMAVAGYAIGADQGILYLRAEYTYLRAFLEDVLKKRRDANLLGEGICGREGFNFDIRIQMGAGAYICGEETALISSCEGLRGDPKTRPPFPAQKGYIGKPTAVNNVETLCCAARILEKGAAWFEGFGNAGSAGTKLLSVSGDCSKPGVYEISFGISIKDLLTKVGAADTMAVQVGGPSGVMIGRDSFERTICFDDLATGGSVMIFNSSRDILKIAEAFMDFFIEESCGYCTPCRVGNVLLKEGLDKIISGAGEPADLDYLAELGRTVKAASRCGLGQTSPNPILTTLENFRSVYNDRVKKRGDGLQPDFDLKSAVSQAEAITNRKSVHC